MIRFLSLTFMFTLALLPDQAARASGLPDSGQDQCYNGSDILAACSAANTGDLTDYPRQDGRYGRDAKAAAGLLAKSGAGMAGFDYTKIANNGSELQAEAALGYGATDWACTRDNLTGLSWEVKTAANTDLRHFNHVYYWYSSDAASNGGNAGSTGANTCNATLPGGLCNTQAFVTAVNSIGLCGHNDWRLPTLRELDTLSHFGKTKPSIDTSYFPNTYPLPYASLFWTASSRVPDTSKAWGVYSFDGESQVAPKASYQYLRLVRGTPF